MADEGKTMGRASDTTRKARVCFSVAMSVYASDNPYWLNASLASICINQTCKPNEIVMVVDGPISKEIDSVIRKYEIEQYGLRVIRLSENRGLGNALRVAVRNCKYEVVARMDSDDIAVFNRFEQQLAVLESNPSIDIVGGDICEFIGEEENIVARRCVPEQDCDIKSYMKIRSPLNHVTVMFKRCAVQDAGGYLDLYWNEDYYLWIRMAEQNYIMANTGTVLVNVRISSDMYKRRGGYRYYNSEVFLQRRMLKNGMITPWQYTVNCTKRYIVQCLMPSCMRAFVFRKFARKSIV